MTTKRKPAQIPQWGLCIDWETSGSTWGGDSSILHQGVAVGIIVFKTSDFTAVEELYLEIKFDESKYKWSDEAEKVHGISREHLEQNGVTQEEAAQQLVELIVKYWGTQPKVMLLGHNTEFDRRFTNQLLQTVGVEFSAERSEEDACPVWIQVHHVLLDTSSCSFIVSGVYRSDEMFAMIGFDERGAHNALDDARMTLDTAAVFRALMKEALGV